MGNGWKTTAFTHDGARYLLMPSCSFIHFFS